MASQGFFRGLRDLKIAAWVGPNSYGTSYDVLGAREATAEWQLSTDMLEGDDVVLDRFSKATSVTLRLSNAAVDLTVLDMLLGGTLVSNASYEDFFISEVDEVPYVAIAARVVGSGGSQDLHLFLPKCKLSGNLQYQAQLNQYLIPAAEFQAVNEGSLNGMMRVRKFTALTGLEIPLRTTTGFS